MIKSFSQVVLRNSLFGLGANFAIKLLSFAFNVLVIRNLGKEDYGQYAAIGAFGSMFLFISDLGLSAYSVREAARWRDAPDSRNKINGIYGNLLWLRILLSVLAGVCMVIAAFLTGRPAMMIAGIAINAAGLIIFGIQGASDAILSAHERLDIGAQARVINQITFIVLGGVALWLGWGYFGLIGANIIAITLLMAVCLRGVHQLGVVPAKITPATWGGLIRTSVPFGLITLALGLSYKFDSVLLNIYRSDGETGSYNAAYNLIFSAIMFSNVLNTSLYPSLARRAATAPQRLNEIYQRVCRYLLVISLPITVGVWALAHPLIEFLYQNKYPDSATVLQILIWVVPFMYLSEFLGYIVVIAGRESRVARSVIISTVLNVVCNLIVVPRFGIMGAAIVTVATEVILVGQYVYILREELSRFNLAQVLVRPIIAASVMGLAILGLQAVAQQTQWLVLAAAGAIAYAGMVVCLRVLGRDEITFVQNLRKPA